MATVSIPVQAGNSQQGFSSRYTVDVELEGQTYAFVFYLNSLASEGAGRWYMDILDPVSREPAVAGAKLVYGLQLTYRYRYLGDSIIPPGQLYVANLENSRTDPDATAFQEERAQLRYLTSDEVTSEVS